MNYTCNICGRSTDASGGAFVERRGVEIIITCQQCHRGEDTWADRIAQHFARDICTEGYTGAFPEMHARGEYVVWPTPEPAQMVDALFEELFHTGGGV